MLIIRSCYYLCRIVLALRKPPIMSVLYIDEFYIRYLFIG